MVEKDTSGIMLPIEWHVPDDLVSRYASNVLIQHTEHEFVLSFFELQPPLTVGSPEEQVAQLEAIGAVRAECVARIIISPARIGAFIEALTSNHEKYLAALSEQEGES
jgi:hypothetical protein